MTGIEVIAVVAGAYYAGRTRQWWLSRNDRKTAGAINHLAEKLSKSKGDK